MANDKIKTIYNKPYNGVAPISHGNSYEVFQDLKAQEKIDKSNIDTSAAVIGNVNNTISNLTSKITEDHLLNEYFLLQLHANYFCGTIEYECENPTFRAAIQKLIRIAFLYGRACLWINNENEIGAMYISKMKTNAFGNIESITIGNGDDSLSTDALKKQGQYKGSNLVEFKKKEDIDNCIVFNWGTRGTSAWIMVWPFVKQQHMLMKMLNIQAFNYNKKFVYKIGNPSVVGKELDMYLNPANPFVTLISSEDEASNRFESLEIKNSSTARDFVAFYREYCDIWYQLIGKQSNVDFKKERNVSNEVDASQKAILTIQYDYLIQFEIFVKNLAKHPIGKLANIKFSIVEEEEKQTESIEEEEKINGNDERND